MAKDRDALLAAVKRNVSDRTDIDSKIEDGFLDVLEDMGKRHEWRELITTPSDVATSANDLSSTLPAGTYKVMRAIFINDTSSYQMRIIPKEEFDRKYPNPTADSTGKPFIGYIQEGKLFFYPKCEGTYAIRYTIYTLPTLAAPGASLPTITTADHVIIAGATAYTFEALERWESGEKWRRKYDIALADAIRQDRKALVEHVQASFGRVSPIKSDYYNDPFQRTVP